MRGLETAIGSVAAQMLAENNAFATALQGVSSSLASPAFEVSRSIATMLEQPRSTFDFSDAIGKATRDCGA